MKKRRKNPGKAKSLKNKTVLHILTGSIAAYKAGDVIQPLRDRGVKVVCVMTEGAKKFVTPLTLRAISGQPVYHDFFATDTPYDVLHTSLGEEADVILVSPASANFIARLAVGICDDLASCTILASKSPVVIAPAMNDNMYNHPVTQENLQKLRDVGYHVMHPDVGHLVCGREAIGHIPGPEKIIKTLEQVL